METVTRNDIDIQRDVIDELDWDPAVKVTDVGVEVDDGIVTLTGTVDDFQTKIAAEHATFRVEGVRAVANDIQLHAAWEDNWNDTDIATAIADAYLWDRMVPHEDIKIRVSNGVVNLHGQANWHFQRTQAADIAQRTKGVRNVINQIEVIEDAASAEEIKDGIERAFIRNAQIDAEGIKVEVDRNHVTLTGNVRSWYEREEAENAAWRSEGVSMITNYLRIVTD